MKDLNSYILNLEKSMDQKMFFVKVLDKNLANYPLIIDFGCGNGELLRRVYKQYPETILDEEHPVPVTFIGYDNNPEMVEHAKNSTTDMDIKFTMQLNDVYKAINEYHSKHAKVLIIFSTVLHEISNEVKELLVKPLMLECDAVVVRDMKAPINNEPIDSGTRKRLLKGVAPWQGKMFEQKWGKIRDKITMYRFFLMNEFVNNFETEVEEDYFNVPWAEIAWALEDAGFELLFEKSYTLPYRKEQVKKRFKHTMNDITHREIIYIKK